ncbi:hypothetical protein BJX65DRAFT_308333 [Aspergillus insuetus]
MSKRRMSGAVPDKDRPKPQELLSMQFGDIPPENTQNQESAEAAQERQPIPVLGGPGRPTITIPPPGGRHALPPRPPVPQEFQSHLPSQPPSQSPSVSRLPSHRLIPPIPYPDPYYPNMRPSPVSPTATARLGRGAVQTPAPSQRPTQMPTEPRSMRIPAMAQGPVPASAQPPVHTSAASQRPTHSPTAPRAMQTSTQAQAPTTSPPASQHANHVPTAPRTMWEQMPPYGQQSPYATHRTQQYQPPVGPTGQEPTHTLAGPLMAERQEEMSAYGPQPGQTQEQWRSSEMPPPPSVRSRFGGEQSGQYYFQSTRSQPLELVPEEEIAAPARASRAIPIRAPALSTVRGSRVEKHRAGSKASASSSSSGASSIKSKNSVGSTARATRRVSPEQRVAQLARSLNNTNLNAGASDFQPVAQAVQVAHNRNVRLKQVRTAAERQALEELVLNSARRDLVFSGSPDTVDAARREGWTRPTERQQVLFRTMIEHSHGLPLLQQNRYPGTDNAQTFLLDSVDPTPLPRIVAMDCEMVGVEGHTSGDYTVRICLVDVLTGEVLMDHVIVPPAGVRITDWRTEYSGMTQAVMDLYTREGRILQGHQGAINHMRQIVDNRAYFVGHALHNDFDALGITHSNVIDTALITQQAVTNQMAETREPGRCGRTWGLSALCKMFLSRDIQIGHHSCLEDTYAARELALYFGLNTSALQLVTTWAREQVNSRTFTVYYDPPKKVEDADKDGENQQGGNKQGEGNQGEDKQK